MSSDKYDIENGSELVYAVLLLAEGKADVSFLMQLMTNREIAGLHFGFPTDTTGGFGITGLGKYLGNLPAKTGFDKLKAILVLYDNDNDPAAQFAAVRALINPEDPYVIPGAPLTLAQAEHGKKRLMFLPMPGLDTMGALETLLLESASTGGSADALACIDELTDCAGCGNWPPSLDAKMRLRCLIAVKCQGNSDVTLTHVWGKTGNPIDLTHACFDAIAQTIRDVVATV